MKPLPKTSIQLMITKWRPMSKLGFERWGHKQRRHLRRMVIDSHIYTGWYFPNGVPVSNLTTDERMIEWVIDNLPIEAGYEYTIQGWSKKKTPSHVGLSSIKARFKLLDEETKKFEVWDTGRMKNYWFRHPSRGTK